MAHIKKITFEFSPHLISFGFHLSKTKWLKGLPFWNLKDWEFWPKRKKTFIRVCKETVKKKRCTFLSYYYCPLCSSQVFLCNKIFVHTHTSSSTTPLQNQPTFSFTKVTATATPLFLHLPKKREMTEFAFSVAEKVIEKLGSLAYQEISLTRSIESDLKKLQDTMSTIQAVLVDAE